MLKLQQSGIIILITAIITIGLTLGATFFINSRFNNGGTITQTISEKTIINRVEDEFFTVTNTVYTDEEVIIEVGRDSGVSEFFWDKKVTATGLVRTDVGIDLSNISEEDIEINNTSNIITIKNVEFAILDSSVNNDIELKTGGSILTLVFDNNTNDDYNLALEKLTESAISTIENDNEIKQSTLVNAENALNYLFNDTGYSVKIQ